MPMNLQLVEHQPRWRVAVVHYFAKAVGVQFKVEGWPFGSTRALAPQTSSDTAASSDGGIVSRPQA